MELRKPDIALPPEREDDPRIGHLFGKRVTRPEDAWVVLVGFPSDEGVRRNQGRLGAAQAPDRIREQLFKMTPDARQPEAFVKWIMHAYDLGNVVLKHSLEESQKRLGALVAPFLRRRIPVIILGGGHETAYGHFLGYVQAEMNIHVLNWDAHLDVRPLLEGRGHSGSPFRQMLEHPSKRCQHYRVVGALPHSVSLAHLEYLRAKGGICIWREEVDNRTLEQIYLETRVPLMVSFDLDAVDQAFAPGVSAPAAGGFQSAEWLKAAYLAGASLHVCSVDVVEYNPRFDIDNQTARLAALTVWHVIAGLATRPL